jgi:hypothetical protein
VTSSILTHSVFFQSPWSRGMQPAGAFTTACLDMHRARHRRQAPRGQERRPNA